MIAHDIGYETLAQREPGEKGTADRVVQVLLVTCKSEKYSPTQKHSVRIVNGRHGHFEMVVHARVCV